MRIIEALSALQFLTKKLISLSDIAEALGKTKGAINNRHNQVGGRSDSLKPNEVKQLEVFFNVDISSFVEKNNVPQSTSTDKTEIIKIVEEYLEEKAKRDNGLSH